MYVRHIADLPAARIPGIEHGTLAGAIDGLEHLSIWQQTLAPQARTPRHSHDCEEVVVVLSGCGELDVDGDIHRFGPGTTLVIPPGVVHEISVTGEAPVELITAFSKARVGVLDVHGASIELPW